MRKSFRKYLIFVSSLDYASNFYFFIFPIKYEWGIPLSWKIVISEIIYLVAINADDESTSAAGPVVIEESCLAHVAQLSDTDDNSLPSNCSVYNARTRCEVSVKKFGEKQKHLIHAN